jgi:hypothetical protein
MSKITLIKFMARTYDDTPNLNYLEDALTGISVFSRVYDTLEEAKKDNISNANIKRYRFTCEELSLDGKELEEDPPLLNLPEDEI